MTEIYEWLNAAEKLAPTPTDRRAPREDWVRHYAALGLAAHAAFRDQLVDLPTGAVTGSRPELGYLSAIAASSTAAAIALLSPRKKVARRIWDLTPEQGALNGEYVDWLAETVARGGINPARLYPWYDEADFAPSVAAAAHGPVAEPEPQAGPTCRHCRQPIVACLTHGEGREGWMHLPTGGHKCADGLTAAEPDGPANEAAGSLDA